MLKSQKKSKQCRLSGALASITLAGCLLTSNLATAHPEKDLYGNDISSRIPAEVQTFALAMPAIEEAGMNSGVDDFRAPKMSREITSLKDLLVKCSRQTPQHCPPQN